MGAWGIGSFENDTALDWVEELLDADNLEPVRITLLAAELRKPSIFHRLLNSDSRLPLIDSDDASMALAASEVVAALKNPLTAKIPEDLVQFIEDNKGKWPSDLPRLATMAVQRVRSHSELAQLWAESEEFNHWLDELSNLEARLA